jgi:hypothetical protein
MDKMILEILDSIFVSNALRSSRMYIMKISSIEI